ncbi:MAG: hypothetical protein HY059_18525 [Proteobacteria bacterium]|nr:hypothetical protein [Pseudomonadota bacterium]
MLRSAVVLSLILAPVAARAELESLSHRAGSRFDGSILHINAPAAPVSARSGITLPPQENAPIITLSQLAEKITSDPAALERIIGAIRGQAGPLGQAVPGFDALNPAEKEFFIRALRSLDKSVLDRFPTMNVTQLTTFIMFYGQRKGPEPSEGPVPPTHVLKLSGEPREAKDGEFLKELGNGFYHGDLTQHGRSDAYGDDVELSAEFNHLSRNQPGKAPVHTMVYDGKPYTGVGEFLTQLMKDGHSIEARDMRMFANFGGLWFQQGGRWISVATPLFVDTGIDLPSGKRLVVPVTHAHVEIDIKGPKVNANVIFYLGLGGSAKWYPNATLDKPWVGAKNAQTFRGAEAVRLAERSAIGRRDVLAKVAKYDLPMGGYGALGACADLHAMITGKPLYPLIRNPRYFEDGMEIDAWSKQLPVDVGVSVSPKRVWDSMPSHDPADVKVPQLRELFLEFKAWSERGFAR